MPRKQLILVVMQDANLPRATLVRKTRMVAAAPLDLRQKIKRSPRMIKRKLVEVQVLVTHLAQAHLKIKRRKKRKSRLQRKNRLLLPANPQNHKSPAKPVALNLVLRQAAQVVHQARQEVDHLLALAVLPALKRK